MAGRKTKYTPETVEKLVQAIGLGATYKLACGYAGISDDTMANWTHRYPDFSDRVKAAEGRGAVGWLAKIEKAASDGNWQAAAWKLERRYPQDYGRTVQEQQHTGKDGADLIGALLNRLPAGIRSAVIGLCAEPDDTGATGDDSAARETIG